jgi:hypothetical protein
MFKEAHIARSSVRLAQLGDDELRRIVVQGSEPGTSYEKSWESEAAGRILARRRTRPQSQGQAMSQQAQASSQAPLAPVQTAQRVEPRSNVLLRHVEPQAAQPYLENQELLTPIRAAQLNLKQVNPSVKRYSQYQGPQVEPGSQVPDPQQNPGEPVSQGQAMSQPDAQTAAPVSRQPIPRTDANAPMGGWEAFDNGYLSNEPAPKYPWARKSPNSAQGLPPRKMSQSNVDDDYRDRRDPSHIALDQRSAALRDRDYRAGMYAIDAVPQNVPRESFFHAASRAIRGLGARVVNSVSPQIFSGLPRGDKYGHWGSRDVSMSQAQPQPAQVHRSGIAERVGNKLQPIVDRVTHAIDGGSDLFGAVPIARTVGGGLDSLLHGKSFIDGSFRIFAERPSLFSQDIERVMGRVAGAANGVSQAVVSAGQKIGAAFSHRQMGQRPLDNSPLELEDLGERENLGAAPAPRRSLAQRQQDHADGIPPARPNDYQMALEEAGGGEPLGAGEPLNADPNVPNPINAPVSRMSQLKTGANSFVKAVKGIEGLGDFVSSGSAMGSSIADFRTPGHKKASDKDRMIGSAVGGALSGLLGVAAYAPSMYLNYKAGKTAQNEANLANNGGNNANSHYQGDSIAAEQQVAQIPQDQHEAANQQEDHMAPQILRRIRSSPDIGRQWAW